MLSQRIMRRIDGANLGPISTRLATTCTNHCARSFQLNDEYKRATLAGRYRYVEILRIECSYEPVLFAQLTSVLVRFMQSVAFHCSLFTVNSSVFSHVTGTRYKQYSVVRKVVRP